jgi:hypothetical protein
VADFFDFGRMNEGKMVIWVGCSCEKLASSSFQDSENPKSLASKSTIESASFGS